MALVHGCLDSVFVKGLQQFRHLVLYATIEGDNIVPYSTAAILPRNPYKTGERYVNEMNI